MPYLLSLQVLKYAHCSLDVLVIYTYGGKAFWRLVRPCGLEFYGV